MTTKTKILSFLDENRAGYISGEQLAEALGISRAAVWKNIKALQSEGYRINAVTNKGYCLMRDTDVLDAQGILKYLTLSPDAFDFRILAKTPSTNSAARKEALLGAKEGLFVLSKEQTNGRGHMGHSFFSPSGTGIYMSLLLRPESMQMQDANLLTCMSAAAMCDVLRELSAKDVRIKWVNDLFADGRKVCGILTEGAMDMESGLVDFCVIGCGVNLYAPQGGFPEELSGVAGNLFDSLMEDAKNKIAAGFLNHFWPQYEAYCRGERDLSSLTKHYKELSLVIDKDVMVCHGQEERQGHVTGMDDACCLEIAYPDGSSERLCVGGGSIRMC